MHSGNMSVETFNGVTNLRLHGNSIACKDAAGVISITNAGWNSRTTNDRLNGLLHYLPGQGRVHCKDFSAHFNGAPWDGSWKVVFIPDTIDTIASRYRARNAALDALTVEANAFDTGLARLAAERESMRATCSARAVEISDAIDTLNTNVS